jgi:hypothetical protein
MSELVLYTLEGCSACPAVVSQLTNDINSGIVKHIHLSEEEDPKEIALNKAYDDGVDGFPTLLKYGADGKRCEVDPFTMKVVKCFN